MFSYRYLSDPNILQYVDNLKQKTQFVRILILDKNDQVLKAIEGRASAGTVNINSASAVRRTASLTLVTDSIDNYDYTVENLDIMNQVTNIKTLIAMNRRCKIEIGIKNSGGMYLDYDIFWFPLGTYAILNATVSYNLQGGITVNLKLADKMVLLTGELGGTIDMAVTHSDPSQSGETNLPSVDEIIKHLVVFFGSIPENKVIIEDVPKMIDSLVTYIGPNGAKILFDDEETLSKENVLFGDEITWTTTSFVWPSSSHGELKNEPGESVMQVLEKVKTLLGNFEYYFDLEGNFRFREIKNYLNEGSAKEDLTEALNDKYFINTNRDKSTYSFTNSNLIASYSNDPQYSLIKNDYVVWGKVPNTETPIQYHLIIDTPPRSDEQNKWYVKTEEGKIIKASSIATDDMIWINLKEMENVSSNLIAKIKMFLLAIEKDDALRTPLDKELVEHFQDMITLTVTGGTLEATFIDNPVYYFDVINVNDIRLMNTVDMKNFAISDIGKRTKVIEDNTINCIFYSSLPKTDCSAIDIIEVNGNQYSAKEDIENMISIGTKQKSAFDTLRSVLHESLGYNNNINLTTIPIYHLDVNQRITVENYESDIHGDYIIDSISVPLTVDGMMSITARKAAERI